MVKLPCPSVSARGRLPLEPRAETATTSAPAIGSPSGLVTLPVTVAPWGVAPPCTPPRAGLAARKGPATMVMISAARSKPANVGLRIFLTSLAIPDRAVGADVPPLRQLVAVSADDDSVVVDVVIHQGQRHEAVVAAPQPLLVRNVIAAVVVSEGGAGRGEGVFKSSPVYDVADIIIRRYRVITSIDDAAVVLPDVMIPAPVIVYVDHPVSYVPLEDIAGLRYRSHVVKYL